MTMPDTPCSAFHDHRLIAAGPLITVAEAVKAAQDAAPSTPILVFDEDTGEQLHLDLRGPWAAVRARLEATTAESVIEPPRPGRPKLGVVAREVTLLPRHWDWLTQQPGGASAAIRRLVEEARRTHAPRDRFRKAQEAAHRILNALAGDLPQFEEALRAFYAGDAAAFESRITGWPTDVRQHASALAENVRALDAAAA
jgi:hypothetical protein